jgi:hypothetical protein
MNLNKPLYKGVSESLNDVEEWFVTDIDGFLGGNPHI